jgi:hypothetical protein
MPEDTDAGPGIVDGSGVDPAGSAPPAEGDTGEPKKSETDWEAMYKGESKARVKAEAERDAASKINATLTGISERLGALEQTTLNLDLVTASIRDDVANSGRRTDELDDDGEPITPELSTSYADAAQQRASGLSQSQFLNRSKERIERDLETLGDRLSDRDEAFIKKTWATASKEGELQPGMGSQLEAYVSRLVALDATQRLAEASNGEAPSVEKTDNSQGDDGEAGDGESADDEPVVDDPLSAREKIAASGGLGTGVTGKTGAAPDNTTVKARVIESGDPTDAFAQAYADSEK